MKAYARHYSLRKLVYYFGWELVGTNEEEEIKKEHLLQMRRSPESLVFDVMPSAAGRGYPGNLKHVENLRHKRIEGSEWNSNFYGVTFKGLMLIKQLFPDMEKIVYKMILHLLNNVFNGTYDEWELKKRGMPE